MPGARHVDRFQPLMPQAPLAQHFARTLGRQNAFPSGFLGCRRHVRCGYDVEAIDLLDVNAGSCARKVSSTMAAIER